MSSVDRGYGDSPSFQHDEADAPQPVVEVPHDVSLFAEFLVECLEEMSYLEPKVDGVVGLAVVLVPNAPLKVFAPGSDLGAVDLGGAELKKIHTRVPLHKPAAVVNGDAVGGRKRTNYLLRVGRRQQRLEFYGSTTWIVGT